MVQREELTRSELVFAAAFILGLLVKHNVLMLHVLGILVPGTQLLRSLAILVVAYALVVRTVSRSTARVGMIVFASLWTGVFLANLWYNRYFGNYLSLREVTTGEGYNPVGVLFRHIMRPSDSVYLLDVIAMVTMSIRASGRRVSGRRGAQRREHRASRTCRVPVGTHRAMAGLVTVMVVSLIGQSLLVNHRLGGLTPTELFIESTPAFAGVYGVVPLYAYEPWVQRQPAQPEVSRPPEIPERRLRGEPIVDPDSNVIVIQVESLDKKLINYHHNGREVTPFVNSLVQTSLSGTNFYAQHVNGSFDADFSLLTGLYPVNRQYSFRDHDMSRFPSLVEIFNAQGYQTLAFHGNDASFFNRDVAYAELGFDRFYGRADYALERRRYRIEDNVLGINDYAFFKQSLDFLDDAEPPFFAYFITVTSHTPFTFYPEQYAVGGFDDLNSQLVRDFFNSIRFVDSALQMFFQGLEARGLKDNTLLVIYSDHEAAIATPEYSSSINFEVDRNIKEPEHIPLIIRHPDIEPGTLEKTGSITDLAPTILDILGFERIPTEFIGSSLLQPDPTPVLFIHELPQVLYRDQLFVAELEDLTRTGHIEGRYADIVVPAEKKHRALEKIRYSREIMMQRRRVTE